jgi:hypothetical protein
VGDGGALADAEADVARAGEGDEAGEGMVDEEIPGSYGEDYDMMLRAAYLAPIPVVNRPYVSVTWARNSYYFGRWGLYADALEFLLRKHPDFESDAKGYGRTIRHEAFDGLRHRHDLVCAYCAIDSM